MKKFVEKLVGVTLVVYILLVVIVFGWALLGSGDDAAENSPKNTPVKTNTSTNAGTGTATAYTKAEVANHNTSTDCWTIFNGKVYNVTDYFGMHPGGNNTLLELCGTDGSTIYNSMHRHSSSATAIFESYYVGDVKN